MTDKKISELTNITGANLADADEFVVVDSSASETKAITWAELKEGLDTGTGFVRITGDTMTGDLSFGDNDKAIFGASSDLQIYHDGSNSIIKEITGAGSLHVQADFFKVLSTDGTETKIFAQDNGYVKLYFDNLEKLATTNTGVDVTGTITSDGLTLNGSANQIVQWSKVGQEVWKMEQGNDAMYFLQDGVARAVYSTNGDISFYEDTGTTPKMVWKASDEALGIGTSSPSSILHLQTPSGTAPKLWFGQSATSAWSVGSPASVNALVFTEEQFGSEKMRIDSSGNVGIGTSSPSSRLHVTSTADDTRTSILANGVSGDPNFQLAAWSGVGGTPSGTEVLRVGLSYGTTKNSFIHFHRGGSTVGGFMSFSTNDGTERMRIDSSGNVGIGTSSPSIGKLHLNYDSVNNRGIRLQDQNGTYDIITSGGGDNNSFGIYNDTAGAYRLFIDSSGNVGIGTTSPSANLDIQASSDIWELLKIQNTGGSRSSLIRTIGAAGGSVDFGADGSLASTAIIRTGGTERMRIDSSGNVGIGVSSVSGVKMDVLATTSDNLVARFENNHATGSYGISVKAGDDSGNYAADFANKSGTSLMRIRGDGNVGIGTSSPDTKLHVSKSSVSGTSYDSNDLITIENDGFAAINMISSASTASTLIFSDATRAVGLLQYNHSDNSMRFNTSATEAMRIDSSGNVGIGVTPSAWGGNNTALQIRSSGFVQQDIATNVGLGRNAVQDGPWSYIGNGYAQMLNLESDGAFKFFQTGSGTAGNAITFTQAMTLDASGNLLVGKTSQNIGSVGFEATPGSAFQANASTASGKATHTFNRLSTDGDIATFRKDGATVGSIGTIDGDLLVGTGDTHLRFNDGAPAIYTTNAAGTPIDADADLGASSARFKDLYLSGSIHGDVKFENNAGTTEYARFDSSGNLLVGKSSQNQAVEGFEYSGASKYMYLTRGGGVSAYFDRLTSDGDIVEFRKAGTPVGSIGSYFGDLYIASPSATDAGIGLGNSKISPVTTTGALRDAAIDLGASAARFKDLYLSGGVYLGGTTSANLLDDYEEGTFTATLDFSTSSTGGLIYTNNTFRYIKIGDMVFISGFLTWSQNNFSASSGNLRLEGLPFSTPSTNAYRGGVSITYSGSPWTGLTVYQQSFRAEISDTRMFFNYSDTTDGSMDSTITSHTSIDSTGEIMITGSYPIA